LWAVDPKLDSLAAIDSVSGTGRRDEVLRRVVRHYGYVDIATPGFISFKPAMGVSRTTR
jgi:hypothetical protein